MLFVLWPCFEFFCEICTCYFLTIFSWILLISDHMIFLVQFGVNKHSKFTCAYRIYSIKRPGRLLNFWTLRVGAYSREALIRGWALIKFSLFFSKINSEFILQRNNK